MLHPVSPDTGIIFVIVRTVQNLATGPAEATGDPSRPFGLVIFFFAIVQPFLDLVCRNLVCAHVMALEEVSAVEGTHFAFWLVTAVPVDSFMDRLDMPSPLVL